MISDEFIRAQNRRIRGYSQNKELVHSVHASVESILILVYAIFVHARSSQACAKFQRVIHARCGRASELEMRGKNQKNKKSRKKRTDDLPRLKEEPPKRFRNFCLLDFRAGPKLREQGDTRLQIQVQHR
jgi:hypothetical protein